MLALVARIGKSGQAFAVGAKFSGRAPASGALHLAVVPFQYTTAVSGSYSVVARSR